MISEDNAHDGIRIGDLEQFARGRLASGHSRGHGSPSNPS
jgi:hypothetical protein